MNTSFLPIWFVDMVGSVLMIVFSFLCLNLVRALKRRDPDSAIWTYLLWVCIGMACFAVSRSAGHIVKQILLLSGHAAAWERIRPFSGAINTLMIAFVASVTLFFERMWRLYQQIMKDKQAVQDAHAKLVHLNQNLEELVRQRTAALAASEKKFRRIFEVSRDMILTAYVDGEIIDVNPAGLDMLGTGAHPEGSPVGKRFQNYFNKLRDWQDLINTIAGEGFVLNAEVDLRRNDGRSMRALISGSLDNEPAEKDQRIHFLVKDIEQRRLMREQMAQADRLASIGQLASGIAHEINNPLSVILGFTQLMIRQESPETERHRDLKTIEKHVRSCKTIVEDLLSFSRRSEPKKEVVNIHKTIDEVVEFIRHHSAKDKVAYQKNYGAHLPAVLVDEKKIKQVLINLIMNAKHAVADEGTISLTTAFMPAEKKIRIDVTDDGHGIEATILRHIFDPFFTTKPTGEGTGLGLSVSYGIVKKHGGEILVQSRPGRGSTFSLILPVSSNQRTN